MGRAALVALLALVTWACPLPPPPLPSAGVPGVYHARLPAADASARVVTLWLQPGGTAILETVYVGKPRLPTENGSWSASGDELTVQIDGQQAPLVYSIDRDRLVPKRWDEALYGTSGLPLTRRASYQPPPSIFEVPQKSETR